MERSCKIQQPALSCLDVFILDIDPTDVTATNMTLYCLYSVYKGS